MASDSIAGPDSIVEASDSIAGASDSILGTPYIDLDLIKVRNGKPCRLSDFVAKGIPVILILYSCWANDEVIYALERAEANAKKVGKKNAVFICLNCEVSRSVESLRRWLEQPMAQLNKRKAASARKKKKKDEDKAATTTTTGTATAITRSETLESFLLGEEGQGLMEASIDEIKKAYEAWLTGKEPKGGKKTKKKKKKAPEPVALKKTYAVHLQLAAPDKYNNYDIGSYPLFVVFDEKGIVQTEKWMYKALSCTCTRYSDPRIDKKIRTRVKEISF